MKTRIFRVHSDPGHAWVKVPKEFLRQIIGKDWRKVFTHFSYERDDHVYLEEDEDASRFINWCRASGIEPVFKGASTGIATHRSRIRTYSPLQPIGD
ncbi:MAG: hypothetical protein ACO24H_08025 [Polynucleobacter sp.]